jgi:Ethylbenzene dehydrogenase/Secretion system C-terminal sorting domain
MILPLALSANAQTTLTATQGTAVLDGTIATDEYTSQALVTANDVTMYAMGDGEYLYLAAQWTDKTATENIRKKMWTYDGTSWSQSGDEDRFGIIWDMGLSGDDGASCTAMCHFDDKMRTNVGQADNWHWKAARGGVALGYVDDKWVGTDNMNGDSGTSTYKDNSADSNGNPSFMPAGGPSESPVFLGADADAVAAVSAFTTENVSLATTFDPNAAWVAGSTIPGYLMRIPDGDRASIRTASSYKDGVWTVEFKRAYAGSEHDFTVVPGGHVNFTHETFDNQGHTHPDDGVDPQIYTLDFSQLSGGTNLLVTSGAPTLDGVVTPGEWTSQPLVTAAGVTLNSMADGSNFYMSAQWVDKTGTETLQKKMWKFNGTSWSQSGDEDRIGFIFDMGLNGADGANCTTMCHFDDKMRTNIGPADNWHWKAARGGVALGYLDDKWVGTDNMNGDPGTSTYQDNSADSNGNPSFMPAGGPTESPVFLGADAAAMTVMTSFTTQPASLATTFDPNAAWVNGSTIPGYIMRVPEGDRASVKTASSYTDGVWTVEFMRAYAGSAYDFAVVPGGSVEFTHEIFDNQGHTHPDDGIDATIYTLDFSTITGVETLASDELPASYSLEQNYPNPFNPVTRIRFNVADAQHVALNIYDSLGRLVRSLVDRDMLPGRYEVEFSGDGLASGIYFYQIAVQNTLETRQMVLLK